MLVGAHAASVLKTWNSRVTAGNARSLTFYDIINNVRSSRCDQYCFQNLYVTRFLSPRNIHLISFRISLRMTSAHMADSLQIVPNREWKRGKNKVLVTFNMRTSI